MAETWNTPGADTPPGQSVDLLRETDVAYWCQIFGVSPAHLREAVQHAGSKAVDVAHYLRTKGYAGTV